MLGTRSAHWPKLRKVTSVTNCGYVQSRSRPTARSPYVDPRPVRSTDPVELGQKLAAEMLAEGAAELINETAK